ncbi:MAG: L,D-transpeptidase family protein [Candidatus Omnitrophica bacterium]|nr:L,D-transpeptidase family protein [Candidatus Omnitrophota bacterium]
MNKKLIAIVLAVSLVILLAVFGIKNILLTKSFRKLKMTPDKVDTIYEYGLIQYAQKDFDKAMRAFEIVAAQKLDPEKKEDALFKLVEICQKKNKLDLVRNHYKKIIEDFPNAEFISKIQSDLESINIKILFSPIITEDSFQYEIKPNDTLSKIAKNYNTTVELLKKSNDLKNDIIVPKRTLKVTKAKFSILVDKSQNLLFLKKSNEIMKIYRVSTGLNNSTPVGKFKIEEKLISPLWYKVGAVVPPDSPEYELGKHWMGLSVAGYGIHGTNDSDSIGKHITKGCIRMLNENIEELYAVVPSGTEVVIVD